jgi:hypothetical protein
VRAVPSGSAVIPHPVPPSGVLAVQFEHWGGPGEPVEAADASVAAEGGAAACGVAVQPPLVTPLALEFFFGQAGVADQPGASAAIRPVIRV